MASYPITAPISIDRPAAGQTFVDIVAAPLERVTAPEAGELVYVGDGTHDPFTGYAPGVVVLYGARSGLSHVFGFIDRAYVDSLRGGGVWGWTGGIVRDGLLDPLIPDVAWKLEDAVHAPTKRPRPQVTEGQLIGYVAPSRARLRWTMVNVAGLPTSPLPWAAAQGLAPPAIVDPLPQAPPGGDGAAASSAGRGLLWLVLGYLASEELF